MYAKTFKHKKYTKDQNITHFLFNQSIFQKQTSKHLLLNSEKKNTVTQYKPQIEQMYFRITYLISRPKWNSSHTWGRSEGRFGTIVVYSLYWAMPVESSTV